MNTIKHILLPFLFLFGVVDTAFAQNAIKPLKLGDTLPDFELNLYNHTKPSVKISNFKDKAILLDFWATWCSPCIASFPKLISLQKKFSADLIILPVTYEKRAYIKSFAEKLKRTKQIDLMSVVDDVSLHKVFPHSSIPHYVWVDKGGVVKGISYMEDVTEQNLKKLISGSDLALKVKSEVPSRESPYKLIFSDTSIIFHQGLVRYISGVPGGWGFPVVGGMRNGNGILLSNVSLLSIYQVAYGESLNLINGFKYTKLITNDTTKFTDNSEEGKHFSAYRAQWIKDHGLNYILKVPIEEKAKKWAIMRENLKTCFPDISARLVKEMRPTLVLRKTDGKTAFAAKSSDSQTPFQNATGLKIQNGSMNLLISMLRYYFQRSPYDLKDETNYKEKIDINLEANMSDVESLNAALNKYGLKLDKANREIDILEIIDHSIKSVGK